MNRMYPIFLKLEGVKCLVVGGGEVASRKIKALLECGASVLATSHEFNAEIKDLASSDNLRLDQRCFIDKDLEGMLIVIVATDDMDVNKSISKKAMERGLLVNVVDQPELCNFYVPSSLTRGDLKIAISTAGKSPATAKKIREFLEEQFDDSWADLLKEFGEARDNRLKDKRCR